MLSPVVALGGLSQTHPFPCSVRPILCNRLSALSQTFSSNYRGLDLAEGGTRTSLLIERSPEIPQVPLKAGKADKSFGDLRGPQAPPVPAWDGWRV